jgi:PHD/YefM family antitoxin component YafN of YafNO toxin-antitoxin module
VDAALTKGPQVVTRRGVETAVLVPIAEWRRIQSISRPSIKELLMSGPRFENLIPPRRKLKRRPPVEFE